MSERAICWVDFETGGLDAAHTHAPLSIGVLATRGEEILGEYYAEIRQAPMLIDPVALSINKLDITALGKTFEEVSDDFKHFLNEFFYGGCCCRPSPRRPSGGNCEPMFRPHKDNMPFFGGQNTFFDRPILNRILHQRGDFHLPFVPDPTKTWDGIYYHRVDTMVAANFCVAKGKLQVENLKLETLARALGIQVDGVLHHALTDCKTTFKVWRALLKL